MTNEEAGKLLQGYGESINTEENRNALVASKVYAGYVCLYISMFYRDNSLDQSSFNALIIAKHQQYYVYKGLSKLQYSGLLNNINREAFLSAADNMRAVYLAFEALSIFRLDQSSFDAVMKLNKDGLLNEASVDELIATRQRAKAAKAEKIISLNENQLSMMVLGGFITALGITAVAVGLTVATLGIPGLIIAGVGVVAILVGVGLFACSAYERLNNNFPINADSLFSKDRESLIFR